MKTSPVINVGVLASTLAVGGAERVLQTLARGLRLRSYNFYVICLRRRGPLGEELATEGFTVDENTLLKPGEWGPTLGRLRRCDVILALDHHNVITLLGTIAPGMPPAVVWFHLQGPPRPSWRPVMKKAAAVVAVASSQRRYLAAAGVAANVRLIPNGVVIPPPLTAADRAAAKTSFSLPPTRAGVGAVARLSPEKGIDVLLRALAHIPPQDRPVALVAGDGPERDRLQAYARGALSPEDCTLLGKLRDPSPVYRAADILVVPSRRESLPLALLEGMAHGLPVVASAVGDVPEVVSPGGGILVPPENDRELSSALLRLQRDPQLREELGTEARNIVAGRFAVGAMLDAFDHLLRSVVNREV